MAKVRRIQTDAVLHWTWSFLFKGITGTIWIFCVLLYISFWYFSFAYLVWFWFDYKTCERGGRRSSRVRNWPLWNYIRDYFPVQLVKTVDLDPNKNYVCGYHPHGMICAGALTAFCNESVGFSTKFPNICPFTLTLPGQFQIPWHREFVMATVGKPFDVEKIENPTEADINRYHSLYIESLTKLFDEHKVNYDYYKNATLIV